MKKTSMTELFEAGTLLDVRLLRPRHSCILSDQEIESCMHTIGDVENSDFHLFLDMSTVNRCGLSFYIRLMEIAKQRRQARKQTVIFGVSPELSEALATIRGGTKDLLVYPTYQQAFDSMGLANGIFNRRSSMDPKPVLERKKITAGVLLMCAIMIWSGQLLHLLL